MAIAGPLWIKPLFNKELISDVLLTSGDGHSGEHYNTIGGTELLSSSGDQRSGITYGGHRPDVTYSEGPLQLPPTQRECPSNKGQGPSQKNSLRHIIGLLKIASIELDEQPFYYTIDEVGSALKISPPPMSRILERLVQEGFGASRTSFRPTGFKTHASMEEIKKLL